MGAIIHSVLSDSVFVVHNDAQRNESGKHRRQSRRRADHEHDDHLEFRCAFHGRASKNSTSHHTWDRYYAKDTARKNFVNDVHVKKWKTQDPVETEGAHLI